MESLARACLHYPQPISDEREVDTSDKHDVELCESREDAPKALEPAEQPFDLVAPLIRRAGILSHREWTKILQTDKRELIIHARQLMLQPQNETPAEKPLSTDTSP